MQPGGGLEGHARVVCRENEVRDSVYGRESLAGQPAATQLGAETGARDGRHRLRERLRRVRRAWNLDERGEAGRAAGFQAPAQRVDRVRERFALRPESRRDLERGNAARAL